LLARNFWI
jgi:hypothetical protein